MQEGYFSVYPIPEESELCDLYKKQYYQETKSSTYEHDYSEDEINYKKIISEQIIYAIDQHHSPDGTAKKILEIGYGEGFTLAAALKKEWEISGLEITDFALRKFHPQLLSFTLNMDIHKGISHFQSQGNLFDAIVLQNVLEHVRKPEEALDEVQYILKPNGILSITVPNDESLFQLDLLEKGFIEHEYWFVPPQHLHYFNSENIGNLATTKGYKVIDMYSDFPIEYFLYHPSANYITNKEQGAHCHKARVDIFNQLASKGMKNLHQLCQAQANCGIGRAISVLMKKG